MLQENNNVWLQPPTEKEFLAKYPYLTDRWNAEVKSGETFLQSRQGELRAFMEEVKANPQDWMTSITCSPR